MIIRKSISIIILGAFLATSIKSPVYAQMAQDPVPSMPAPGLMVHLSPVFTPALLKGLLIHPENALKFDFIVGRGDMAFTGNQKKVEYTKLIKYFLASLAVPDEDQWVNLSPYEKDRIIKDDFGKTEMGRDLLAEDYILKQITASLIYPEDTLGKKFWDKIYSQAYRQFGTTTIPINTFNKVWILPDSAELYEKGNAVFLIKSHLKVMLEEDYLSLQKHSAISNIPPLSYKEGVRGSSKNINTIGSQIVREVVLPALEKEINTAKNFAPLRQAYSGMILAAWYKRALRESLLGKIYVNKSRVKGIDQDPRTNEAIYHRYLKAYKKGVFNLIKEDVDKYTNTSTPRKYFSGGVIGAANFPKFAHMVPPAVGEPAMIAIINSDTDDMTWVGGENISNPAMNSEQMDKVARSIGGLQGNLSEYPLNSNIKLAGWDFPPMAKKISLKDELEKHLLFLWEHGAVESQNITNITSSIVGITLADKKKIVEEAIKIVDLQVLQMKLKILLTAMMNYENAAVTPEEKTPGRIEVTMKVHVNGVPTILTINDFGDRIKIDTVVHTLIRGDDVSIMGHIDLTNKEHQGLTTEIRRILILEEKKGRVNNILYALGSAVDYLGAIDISFQHQKDSFKTNQRLIEYVKNTIRQIKEAVNFQISMRGYSSPAAEDRAIDQLYDMVSGLEKDEERVTTGQVQVKTPATATDELSATVAQFQDITRNHEQPVVVRSAPKQSNDRDLLIRNMLVVRGRDQWLGENVLVLAAFEGALLYVDDDSVVRQWQVRGPTSHLVTVPEIDGETDENYRARLVKESNQGPFIVGAINHRLVLFINGQQVDGSYVKGYIALLSAPQQKELIETFNGSTGYVTTFVDRRGGSSITENFKSKTLKEVVLKLKEFFPKMDDGIALAVAEDITEFDAEEVQGEVYSYNNTVRYHSPFRVRINFKPVITVGNPAMKSDASMATPPTTIPSVVGPSGRVSKLTNGGIDFNAANLRLQIKRDGNGVPLPVSQQDLENIHLDGLFPVIIAIKPMSSSLSAQLQLSGMTTTHP